MYDVAPLSMSLARSSSDRLHSSELSQLRLLPLADVATPLPIILSFLLLRLLPSLSDFAASFADSFADLAAFFADFRASFAD